MFPPSMHDDRIVSSQSNIEYISRNYEVGASYAIVTSIVTKETRVAICNIDARPINLQ